MKAQSQVSVHRLLVIDDLPSIHDDFRKILLPPAPATSILQKASLLFGPVTTPPQPGSRYEIDFASQGREGLAKVQAALAAKRPYAVAFVDMRMPPGWDGLETVQHLWEADPRLQVVICTAHSDYTWTELNAKLGNSDNLIILKKPFDNIEVQQLANALTSKWQLARELDAHIHSLDELVNQRTAELIRANDEISASERRFRMTLAAAQQGLYDMDVPTRIIQTSEEYARILGADPSSFHETIENWLGRMPEEDRPGVEAEYSEYLRGQAAFFNIEYRQHTSNGGMLWILMRGNVVTRDAAGRPLRIMGTITDITDRHVAELRLQRTQRLECIGSLASGIAHDINNALVPQLAGASLLRPFVPPDKLEVLDLMQVSARRSAAMLVQLVHFARGAEGKRMPVSPKCLVEEIEQFIAGTFPKNITCRYQCTCPSTVIIGDQTQLHQILLNLCVNARDAMPEGGTLSVEINRIEITEKTAAQLLNASPGPHICMEVRDSGTGIPEGIRERIWDPFFTTKSPEKGTGLGLSTVLGIVKGHGGFIDLESERSKGSVFRVYLPVAEAKDAMPIEESPEEPGPRVTDRTRDTILWVDEEESILAIIPLLFKGSRFTVVSAKDSEQAIAQAQSHASQLGLMIMDVTMPPAESLRLAARIRELCPDMPIIATSGDLTKAGISDLKSVGVNYFLTKPFDRQALFAKLYTVLDQ